MQTSAVSRRRSLRISTGADVLKCLRASTKDAPQEFRIARPIAEFRGSLPILAQRVPQHPEPDPVVVPIIRDSDVRRRREQQAGLHGLHVAKLPSGISEQRRPFGLTGPSALVPPTNLVGKNCHWIDLWSLQKPCRRPPLDGIPRRTCNRRPESVRKPRTELVLHVKRHKSHQRAVDAALLPIQLSPSSPKKRSHSGRPGHSLETTAPLPVPRASRPPDGCQPVEYPFRSSGLQLGRREQPRERVDVDPDATASQHRRRERPVATSAEGVQNTLAAPRQPANGVVGETRRKHPVVPPEAVPSVLRRVASPRVCLFHDAKARSVSVDVRAKHSAFRERLRRYHQVMLLLSSAFATSR